MNKEIEQVPAVPVYVSICTGFSKKQKGKYFDESKSLYDVYFFTELPDNILEKLKTNENFFIDTTSKEAISIVRQYGIKYSICVTHGSDEYRRITPWKITAGDYIVKAVTLTTKHGHYSFNALNPTMKKIAPKFIKKFLEIPRDDDITIDIDSILMRENNLFD